MKRRAVCLKGNGEPIHLDNMISRYTSHMWNIFVWAFLTKIHKLFAQVVDLGTLEQKKTTSN